ncbi:hypothetical protein BJ508DRAFT_380078 [Ascobolus immersus RN42]|uniref:Uncharacterized protein n=1 Tax=Ascobolus immersus RN42 TaxID=1160509 RepID=A0A3N4HQ08_ASCIM|nr:hypothetical protein BJ508DRAFT_380078 [Ascobolus immersus RN42]
MLPTLSPQLADQNPKFANLYTRLTEDLLNTDGSTKNRASKETEEDESLEKDLRSYSALLVKDELLLNALRSIELPDELQVILDLHLATLETKRQPPTPLPPLEDVLADLPPLLRPHIELPPQSLLQLPPNSALTLAPYTVVTRLAAVQKLRLSLHTRRAELAALLTEVCELYETYIRAISDVIGKGGYMDKMGRMLEAKSEFLRGVSEGTEGKAGIYKFEILKAIYDEKAIDALENYRRWDWRWDWRWFVLEADCDRMHLIDTKSRLVAKKRQVQDDLVKYENAGGDMKVLVEKYGEILRTMEQVRADIKRLGGTPHF